MEGEAVQMDRKAVVIAECGKFLVWNLEDVIFLREKCRIVGSFIGSLPGSSQQNEQLGLPLLLLPEEIALLLSKGFAKVYSLPDEVDEELGAKMLSDRDKHVKEQVILTQQKLRETRLARAEQIAKGRKVKRLRLDEATTSVVAPNKRQKKVSQAEIDSTEVTKEEVNIVIQEIINSPPDPSITEDNMHVEMFTAVNDLSKCSELSEIPVRTDRDQLRSAVYAELWAKGHYLSPGMKFGCDYLVYPGDPLVFHSAFLAICLLPSEMQRVTETDIAGWVRLASQVKKKILLCSWADDKQKKISYETLEWTSDRLKEHRH